MRGELDGRNITTCFAFHALIREALRFPAWYGGNLDALYDCLTDLPAGSELVISHFDELEAHLGPAYTSRIRRVLDDAAGEGRFSWRRT